MKKLTKRVQAGGLWFDVPVNINYVAFSHTGDVYCYLKEPPKPVSDWKKSMFHPCGFVSLEGADWRECCWFVGDQSNEDNKPFAWHYDWASCVTCEGPQDFKPCFEYEAPPEWGIADGRVKNLVPLYNHPDESERLEWMARGVDEMQCLAGKFLNLSLDATRKEASVYAFCADKLCKLARKIRSGEVEL